MNAQQSLAPIPNWVPAKTDAQQLIDQQQEQLQETLIKCPFCGHSPKLHMKRWSGERDAIICQCGASMAFDGKTVFFLIRRWNTRGGQLQEQS